MKPHALFVHTTRSALVEKGAREKVLSLENSTYFARDVYGSNPVYEREFLYPPHLGYMTGESFENSIKKLAKI
ncbi:hypothetical protein [Bartonella raoultii]|uniref:hypothetical protein n=1 Tax=Bartonella raoultii TaxID=1457020 RepID=UPI001FEEAD22|nr:hypothetical protein [Bartonella raoultii]